MPSWFPIPEGDLVDAKAGGSRRSEGADVGGCQGLVGLKWLREKKRVRKAADKANDALDLLEKEVKASWSPQLSRAYELLSKSMPVAEEARKGNNGVTAIPAELQQLAQAVKAADERAYQAHLDAEETFDKAERILSTSMARRRLPQSHRILGLARSCHSQGGSGCCFRIGGSGEVVPERGSGCRAAAGGPRRRLLPVVATLFSPQEDADERCPGYAPRLTSQAERWRLARTWDSPGYIDAAARPALAMTSPSRCKASLL